ncbi:trafficking protein particle complex subunit 10 [Cavenderia fasciculata]|uniref:Trafficking protein particle complex subunit 10 n=1 Tax=Cavenderia fasciculata TaxID=261658 RepID=F4PRB5_CACFS|nr:trafficking protein particle complex subunit 10 [Cavenderia fasciculata]EGG21315.1 trafficking protein particle complex subunit 10 [Cavenderia fasciculata]|eukprot:XP_004359165.1 trafficking protein particle complex subunit 10 [Cavenderia fasciculata]
MSTTSSPSETTATTATTTTTTTSASTSTSPPPSLPPSISVTPTATHIPVPSPNQSVTSASASGGLNSSTASGGLNSSSASINGEVGVDHITISYQDDFGVWKYLEPDLWNHLPLRNISWRTKTGHTKIVDKMPVNILPHNDERLKPTYEFQDLYKKPYLYLYLVHCDDADQYKNAVKPKIKQWVTSMSERHQEWLIVLALIYERAQLYEDALVQYFELEVLFTETKTTFESITNNDPGDGMDILDVNKKPYRDLIFNNKISLFDFKHYLFAKQAKLLFLLHRPVEVASRANAFIASIQRIISKNADSFSSPYFREAWVFSVSLEIIKACQDGYEKLSQSPSSLGQGGASGTTVNPKTKIVTPPLSRFLNNVTSGLGLVSGSNTSSPATTPATVSLSSSSSSSFSTTTAASKASSILSGLGITGTQSLTVTQSSTLQGGVSNWMRTPSLNSIAELDRTKDDKQEKELFDLFLSDLLFNAGQKLEELAIKLKIIPKDYYGALFKSVEELFRKDDAPNNISTTSIFSYPPLQAAFQSVEQFRTLYLDVMNQAENLFTQTNRTRALARLKYSVGTFHFKLKEFGLAENLFKSIVNLYARESWTSLEYAVKTKLGYCQQQLNHIVDYTGTCVSLLSPGTLSNKEEKNYYLDQIIQISNTKDLNIVQTQNTSKLFKCKIKIAQKEYRFLEPITIIVKIRSNLNQPMTINSGHVNFVKPSNPSGTVDKLIFSLNDFVLQPGDNILTFSTVGTIKSLFVKESLWLKAGSISFAIPLRGGDAGQIQIIETASAITLDTIAPSPLFLCCVQYITVRIGTHTDSIEKGVLSFSSPSGATIINAPTLKALLKNKHGHQSIVEFAFKNEKIQLEPLDYGEQLEFFLPVMAVNVDPCTHQFRVDFQYQKQTKETYSISPIENALFINPFSVEEQVIPLNNKYFLKIQLQCNAPLPIVITDYLLDECDSQYYENESDRKYSFYLMKDYNQSLKNTTLYPGHLISTIFEFNKYSDKDANRCFRLKVQYINKLQDLDPQVLECKTLWNDQVDFFSPINIDCPSHLYKIDISISKITYLGSIVPLGISISNLQSSNNKETTTLNNVQYSIDYDPSFWTVAGRTKNSFKLANGKTQQFSCDLIPICSGALPLPRINLIGIDQVNVVYSISTNNDHIYVYPPININSACKIISTGV